MLIDEQPGPLVWLQAWYASQCDGDWEHGEGISIDSLDNPGWRVRIDVGRTDLADRTFDRKTIERGEHDWIQAWVEEGKWEAACGPLNLGEALHVFRAWVQGSA